MNTNGDPQTPRLNKYGEQIWKRLQGQLWNKFIWAILFVILFHTDHIFIIYTVTSKNHVEFINCITIIIITDIFE